MLNTMLPDIWFPLVTLSCIAWITWIFISNKSKPQPPLPPGPKGLPVVGMLPFLDPQLHTYFTNLAKTYGPLMSLRLGKKTVVVVGSPLLAKQMLKDLDITFANHDITAASRELFYDGKDMGFTPYGPEFKMLRKVTANGMLGVAVVDEAYNIRRQWLHKTILYLNDHSGNLINIGEQLFLMSFNVIMSMLWGETVMGTKMAREGAEFRRVVTMIIELLGSPNVTDFFPRLAWLDLQGIVKRMRDCRKRLDNMIEAVIEEHRRKSDENTNNEGSKDFVQFLLQLKDEEDSKNKPSAVQLKCLLIDMILAGTETTSNTLEFAMAETVNKPEVMRRAQEELEKVVGAGNRVEESHIHQLTYLQAIMKETLRLNPVVPLSIPHCPNQSCIVGGYTIPKGSAIYFNIWAIHRDPSLWEDPLEFKPERFLDGKFDFNGNNFAYFPFGSGRRSCPGKTLAERMNILSLASLLHYFEWKLPKGVEELDLSQNFGFTMKMATPLLLIPSPRSLNLEESLTA